MNEEDFIKEMKEQEEMELKATGYSTDVARYDDATYDTVEIDYITQSWQQHTHKKVTYMMSHWSTIHKSRKHILI